MNKEKRFGPARSSLLKWHAVHGRHHLPWRQQKSPYAVLVSEYMLQQTTVATVTPRFAEWMQLFPSLATLAAATEEKVLSAWQGLGYYSRAKRLHTAAKEIMRVHGGIIPVEMDALLELPGVGSYTAAAIMAFAHNRRAVVLDTNIIRVLARWGNVTIPVDTAKGRKAIQTMAEAFYPEKECRATASALMDLGATLCTTGVPRCEACPLQVSCQAEKPSLLPRKSPRPTTIRRSELRAWIFRNGRLHLSQSTGPLWEGLWILPELGPAKASGPSLASITYPITRYRVTMKVFRTSENPGISLRGFKENELGDIPIPSPHRKAIQKAFGSVLI